MTLNEKKADEKLLPREVLDIIHGFDGSRDNPEFKAARRGGKRKTKKRKAIKH